MFINALSYALDPGYIQGYMNNSLLLARLIGPFLLLVGIGWLLNVKNFHRIIEDFSNNSALVYITGLIAFIAGLAVVSTHNIWVTDWPIAITIIGWMMLIKGGCLVILPEISFKVARVLLKNVKLIIVPWMIMIAVGAFLTIKGGGL